MEEKNLIRLNFWANKIALLAGGLWFLSLFFNALILYNDNSYLGFAILLNGWQGPLVGNFAWFANLFFVYAFLKQISGRKIASISSAIALVLSLDVMRFHEIVLSAAPTSSPVYGYGIGFVLWFASIWLLYLSVGLRKMGLPEKKNENAGKGDCLIAAFGLALFLIFILSKAATDRIYGNKPENKILAKHNIVFKRGTICGNEIQVPKYKINLTGPLELIGDVDEYPFDLEYVLNWGVPKVRVGNYDFFFTGTEGSYTITTERKSGKASGKLFITENEGTVHLELIDNSNNRQIFEQKWSPEISNYKCPRYTPYNEQPRQIIIDSISNTLSPIHSSLLSKYNVNTLNSQVVSIKEETFEENMLSNSNLCSSRKDTAFVEYEHSNKEIGFVDYKHSQKEFGKAKPSYTKPFKVFDRYYFLRRVDSHFSGALCQDGSIYLYKLHNKGENLSITLSKRNRESFFRDWGVYFKVKDIGREIKTQRLSISILEDKGDSIVLRVLEKELKKSYRLKVDFSNKPKD